MTFESEDFDQKWVERGWWTATQAFCVVTGHSPDAEDDSYLLQTLSRQHVHIYDLICSAELDGSIQEMKRLPSGVRSASCRNWIAWGLTKPSIAENLSEELIDAVGLEDIRKERSNESYRPKDEQVTKAAFLSSARIALHLCPKARLVDIESLCNKANIPHALPGQRTLRNWLKEADIHLSSTTPSKIIIQETLTTLKLSFPALGAENVSLPLEKS